LVKKQEGGFAASLPSLRVAEFACGSFAYPPKLWADRKVRPPISCVQITWEHNMRLQ